MKDYINLFHSMVSEIHFWDNLTKEEKLNKISIFFYDFKNNKYSRIINDALMQYEVRTITEGKAEVTDDGDIFIEESNYGRSLYFDKSGELLWQHVNRAEDTDVFRVAWSRLIYKEEEVEMIDKLMKKECIYE